MGTAEIFRANNILLAEDDEDDRMMFKDVIQQIDQSLNLQTVSDGCELLTHLENLIPDLLFLDLDMPIKNGLECLLSIKENRNLKNLPIVVVSSTTRPVNIQTAYEMGAHLFLIKPCAFNEYVATITSILQLDWNYPEKIKEHYFVNEQYSAFG